MQERVSDGGSVLVGVTVGDAVGVVVVMTVAVAVGVLVATVVGNGNCAPPFVTRAR